jgi:5-methylcytosine-specific restriction enzyme subunit McrC
VSPKIIECLEFEELQVGVKTLIENGEIKIDPRTSGKGYLAVSLRQGQVVFRADRHVGLIPINDALSVRVRPRATIANLSHMLAKSGVAPVAIPDFSRGYLPRFQVGPAVEKLYYKSLVVGIERVLARGMMKSYVKVQNPPAWRGRLLASDTIRRHFSRGVHYRHEFEFHSLSVGATENVALKEALQQVRGWMSKHDRKNPDLRRIDKILSELRDVPEWAGKKAALVEEIGRRVGLLPAHLNYYRDPLWTTFVLLQSKLPDVSEDGSVSLDSLIVDISKIFEAFVRRVLVDRAHQKGWNIRDGNLNPSNFFTNVGDYVVKPDIVIAKGKEPIAVLDAKYKIDPKEGDRYELLSFMDALNVKSGGFILPYRPGERSRYLGTTAGGKKMYSLRFDLSVDDLEEEADRLFYNVIELIEESHRFK